MRLPPEPTASSPAPIATPTPWLTQFSLSPLRQFNLSLLSIFFFHSPLHARQWSLPRPRKLESSSPRTRRPQLIPATPNHSRHHHTKCRAEDQTPTQSSEEKTTRHALLQVLQTRYQARRKSLLWTPTSTTTSPPQKPNYCYSPIPNPILSPSPISHPQRGKPGTATILVHLSLTTRRRKKFNPLNTNLVRIAVYRH
jgi:hypothetical protein